MIKKFALPLLAAGGLSAGLWLSSVRAAPVPDSDSVRSSLIAELTKQQAQLAANQLKIDAMLAEVKEEVRQARLFSARSGGKKVIP